MNYSHEFRHNLIIAPYCLPHFSSRSSNAASAASAFGAALLEEMVADVACRLFAIVQEYGERANGRIAAWGMAFTDHTEVVSVDHTRRMSLQTPENALRLFNLGSYIRAQLVWFNPDTATPPEDDEAA